MIECLLIVGKRQLHNETEPPENSMVMLLHYFQNTRFSSSHKDLLGTDDEEENSKGI